MKVLLIEDSDVFAAYMSRHLKSLGCEVDVATDVPDDPRTCDVILLDLHLPSSAGAETVTLCRRAFPLTPIVVLTSVASPDELSLCISNSASSTLTKDTVTPAAILTAMQVAVLRRVNSWTAEECLRGELDSARANVKALMGLLSNMDTRMTEVSRQLE